MAGFLVPPVHQNRFNGKQKTLALGVYPEVSLAKARERLADARELLADGVDPAGRKRVAGKTFEIVAREWHVRWSAHRHGRYAHYVLGRLEAGVFPWIGGQVPSEIPTSAFRDVVKKIEARGALEIARRVLQNCGQIMRYATAAICVTPLYRANWRVVMFSASAKATSEVRMPIDQRMVYLARIQELTLTGI